MKAIVIKYFNLLIMYHFSTMLIGFTIFQIVASKQI